MNKPTSKYITKYHVRLKTKVKVKLAAFGIFALSLIGLLVYLVQTSELWQMKQEFVYKPVGMLKPEKVLLSVSRGSVVHGSSGWFRVKKDRPFVASTGLILEEDKKYCIIEIIKNGKHSGYIVGRESECVSKSISSRNQ